MHLKLSLPGEVTVPDADCMQVSHSTNYQNKRQLNAYVGVHLLHPSELMVISVVHVQ